LFFNLCFTIPLAVAQMSAAWVSLKSPTFCNYFLIFDLPRDYNIGKLRKYPLKYPSGSGDFIYLITFALNSFFAELSISSLKLNFL
jgi:hypothetical protein